MPIPSLRRSGAAIACSTVCAAMAIGLTGTPLHASAAAEPEFSPAVRLGDRLIVGSMTSTAAGSTARGGEIVHTWMREPGTGWCVRVASTVGRTRGQTIDVACKALVPDDRLTILPPRVDVAVDTSGRAVVAYAFVRIRWPEQVGRASFEVVVRTAHRRTAGAPWSTPTTRAVGPGRQVGGLDVDLGRDGRAVVGWTRLQGGDRVVHSAVRRGVEGTWSEPGLVAKTTEALSGRIDVAWPATGGPLAAVTLVDRDLDARARIGLAGWTERGWRLERRVPVDGPGARADLDKRSLRLVESAGAVLATWTTSVRGSSETGGLGWQAAVRRAGRGWVPSTPGARAYVPAPSVRVAPAPGGFVVGWSSQTAITAARLDARSGTWRATRIRDGGEQIRVRALDVGPDGRVMVGWARDSAAGRVVEVATQRRPGSTAVRIVGLGASRKLAELVAGPGGYALALLTTAHRGQRVLRRLDADAPWRLVRGAPISADYGAVGLRPAAGGALLILGTYEDVNAHWLAR